MQESARRVKMSRIIYTKYSNERTPEFAVKTDIIKYDDNHRVVRKSPGR